MKLERMDAFFNVRVEGYDDHMLQNVDGARLFYTETARLFPQKGRLSVLDLGVGTGLELQALWERNPLIHVTGVDLSAGMLEKLREKYPERKEQLTLIQGDYFAVDFGTECFDAALSVESLHHFSHEAKRSLYRRLRASLKPGGFYVETDYIARSQTEEDTLFAEAARLRGEQGISGGYYHYDTPCTVETQKKLLLAAGFSRVELLWQSGCTAILRAQSL